MKRLGAILIPMLAGFLLTVAVVSWRSGWWQRREAIDSPVAASPRIEVRRPNLRIVSVHLTAGPQAPVGATPPAPVPAASEAEPESGSESYEPPPVPRIDSGNSPEQLEAPERKFARGSRADED